MLTTTTHEPVTEKKFVSERISQCASINIQGSLENVFPLFGPVFEKRWAEGWDPDVIYSRAENIEEYMIFNTPGHGEEEFYTWAVTRFDAENHHVEYTVSTRNRIWFIGVRCSGNERSTHATICYTYTGLTETGNALNRAALKKMYAHELKDWERAINYYLKNGQRLTPQ
jgi:hypothetical protein